MPRVMYKYAKGGKSIQVWCAWAEGADVVAQYGKEGGKQQISRYTAQATNVGRSNERDPEQQAQFELDALYVDRENNEHYRYTKEAALEVYNSCVVPMKITNFKDAEDKIVYPCYGQRKFNGSRLMVMNKNAISKAGRVETFEIAHIREQLELLDMDIDSELYKHGLSLQRIRSATTKTNEDTASLGLVIFDVPMRDVPFSVRLRELRKVQRRINALDLPDLTVEHPVLLNNREELVAFFEETTPEYEGIVIRNTDSLFEFGVRSNQTQKWKPRYDAEAKVVKVEVCKNGDGKLHCIASDALGNVKFKCMMKVKRRDGIEYPRKVADMEPLIGQWITFSYEELSDKGVPTKPVGELPRKCNEAGEPLE